MFMSLSFDFLCDPKNGFLLFLFLLIKTKEGTFWKSNILIS